MDGRPAGVASKSFGSALAQVGETKAFASIVLQVGQPAQDTPDCGELGARALLRSQSLLASACWSADAVGLFEPGADVNVAFSAVCGPEYTQQSRASEAYVIESFLAQMLSKCGVLDLSLLCIETGVAAWKVTVDVTILSVDGCVLDAATVAVSAALLDLKLPQATIKDDGEIVADRGAAMVIVRACSWLVVSEVCLSFASCCADTVASVRMARFPVASTYAIFGGHILVDPSLEELSLATSVVTIATDEHENICATKVEGRAPLPTDVLRSCIQLAKNRTSKTVDQVAGLLA